MRRSFLVLCCAFCVQWLSGCDDEEQPECSAVADPCASEGALQCSSDEGAVEICEADAQGCLQWAVETPCDGAQVCSSEGGEPACACEDACDEGATQCDGDVVQTCEANADDCLVWADGTDCADEGGTCEVADGEAACVAGCEDS
jgi:hypothetical protein